MTNEESPTQKYNVTTPATIFNEIVQAKIDQFVKELRYNAHTTTTNMERFTLAAFEALERAGYKITRYFQNPKQPDKVTSLRADLP